MLVICILMQFITAGLHLVLPLLQTDVTALQPYKPQYWRLNSLLLYVSDNM